MNMKRTSSFAAAALLACAPALWAEDMAIRLDVGTNANHVTFSIVVENNTDSPINLLPHILAQTTTASCVRWKVNGTDAEFFPKRAFLMYPPFDTKLVAARSTNAVVMVEDDELVFVTQTTNAHSRRARPALPTTGEYRIGVETYGNWGGHPPQTASVVIDIEKRSPTSACILRATARK